MRGRRRRAGCLGPAAPGPRGTWTAALSSDRLHLSVAAPPRTVEEALPIAAEHFAFCPDNVTQGYETIRDYVHEALLDKNHWTFWWD